MINTFEMIGRMTIGKETEKFKPYENKDFPSGWTSRSLKFNCIAGDNRHMLSVSGGCFKDGHGDVYVFSKPSVDASGNKVKGESFKIPFKERLTSPKLDQVAEFKKFVVDLEIPNRRYKLEKAAEKIKEGGSLTIDELTELGVNDVSEINEALEKSQKKHHEFISEWDFAEYIKKVIDSDKYKNKKFKIVGNFNHTYSDSKGIVYKSIVPQRIYLAADDTEEYSVANIDFYYNKNSFDDGSLDEKKKYYINGFTFSYDSNRKQNIPVETTIVLNASPEDADVKAKARVKTYVNQFKVEDDQWYEFGLTVNMLNGAQKMEIDESMLTEFQQDALLCGDITMDDIRGELGGSVYGDRIQEYHLIKPARGFTKGRQPTVFTDEDMVIKPKEDNAADVTKDLFENDDEDL